MVLDLHTCLKFRDDNLLVISMSSTPVHANGAHWDGDVCWLVRAGRQLEIFKVFTAAEKGKIFLGIQQRVF